MAKIIFTADDFGVDPSIDLGITELVKRGVIHSVEVFPNYGPNGAWSIENTRKLMTAVEGHNSDYELGVHLTISSGKALTNQRGLDAITHGGRFKSFKYMNDDADPKAIEIELRAQMNVLKRHEDIWEKVTHITNHHDSIWFYPVYTQVYFKIANEFNLPIRSPEIHPPIKEYAYFTWVSTQKKSLEEQDIILEAFDLRKKGKFPLGSESYRSTHYLDSSYYGLFNRLFEKKVKDRNAQHGIRVKKLEGIFETLKEMDEDHVGGEVVAEALFHIRSGSIRGSERKMPRRLRRDMGKQVFGKFDLFDENDIERSYNGIDTKYFDGRSIEFNVLKRCHEDGLLNSWFNEYNITRGFWTEDAVNRTLD